MILCGTMLMFGAESNLQAALVEVNVLVNGNFDTGPGSPWVEYSSKGYQLINASNAIPITPHSGNYVAWLGGDTDYNDSLYQDIAIPSGTKYLSLNLYRWSWTEELTSNIYDQVVVSLRSPTTNGLLETLATWDNLDPTTGWVNQTVTILGDYAGSTVRLALDSSNDSTYPTNFFFDTISLNAKVETCECDLNSDGRCNMSDWLLFGQRWGATNCNTVPCACDLNGDGRCNMSDWLLFGKNWGRTNCP